MKSLGLDLISIPSTHNITGSIHGATLSIATQPIAKNEETLHLNYQETKGALESLRTQKHVFRSDHTKKMLELEERAKKARSSIRSIDKKLEKLEISNLKLDRSITNEKQIRIQEFKSALYPLQTSADIIESTKVQISSKLETLENDLKAIHESKEAKQVSLDQRVIELNQVDFEIQVCKRKIEEIAKEHSWDNMQVFKEAKIKASISKIRAEKQKAKTFLASIEAEINALRDSIENERKTGEVMERPEALKAKIDGLEKEISQLEEFLNLVSDKHQCKGLWQVVAELTHSEHYSLHDIIGKEQVCTVKSRKLEIIDQGKQLEWNFENKIFELNAEIKGLELQYYENVKNDKKNLTLDKLIESKKKSFQEMNEEFQQVKRKNSNKLVTIDKWLEVNRRFLTFDEDFKFPDDESVIQEFILGFSMKKIDKAERDAIQNVVARYMEKVKERNFYYLRITETAKNEKKAAEEKEAFLLQVKAEVKSKDIEREKVQSQVLALVDQEKVLFKELEKCKLEIDSGRRKEVNDLIAKSKASPGKGKMNVEGIKEIKEKCSQQTADIVRTLRDLYETKISLKTSRDELADLIKNELHPELSSLIKDLSSKTLELKSLEEDLIILERSKEELLTKLGLLADTKREELYAKVKDLSKKHGSGQFSSIEKLYNLRASKESELVELELDSIKHQKLLSEKELKNSIEMVKVSTRAETLEKQVRNLKRKQNQRKNHLSCFDIGSSFITEKNSLSRVFETPFNAKSSRKVLDNSNAKSFHPAGSKSSRKLPQNGLGQDLPRPPALVKSLRKLSGGLVPQDSIRSCVRTPECSFRMHEFENESVFEIPLPAEPRYFLAENASESEKKVFNAILPLLEGTILFKKGNGKTTEQFDPLDHSIKHPEEVGYLSKKLKINKQVTKLEIRTVGKSGIDNCIMIDDVRSVNSFPITNAIIKAQNMSVEGIDMSLESIAKCSKEYREMKYSGRVNYSSGYFIVKSKETHYYPFYIVLKSGKAEFVAESLQDYYAWMNGMQSLINNKALLDKLRFKVKTIE